MMQAIEGIYQNGHIRLLETPKEIPRSRVVVTFLDDEEKQTDNQTSIVGTVEILDDDEGNAENHASLSNSERDSEAGSFEIREQFLRAIEKSGEEVQK